MKKLLLLITLLVLSPIVAKADECTDEILNSYKPYVDKIVITPTRLGDSNTFEIWVKGVSNNLAVEHGRTVLDEGFLGYAQSGDNYIARVYVAYGVCNGKTIEEIKVSIPTAIEQCNDCDEEDTTPPVVVEKPIEDTTDDKTDNESSSSKVDSNKKEESTSSKNETNESTNTTTENDKEEPEDSDKEVIIEDTTESTTNNEVLDAEFSNNEVVEETKNNDRKNEKENTKNIVIFSIVCLLVIIFCSILKYIISKKKLSK